MSTGYGSDWCWSRVREGDEEVEGEVEVERRVEGKPREDKYVEAVRNRSLAQGRKSQHPHTHTTKPDYEKPRKGNVPREFLSPLDVNRRDVCTTFLPLGLPGLAAVECGAVEVRPSERIELHLGEVQRRPKLTGRRERVEIRRVDKRVVATAPVRVGFKFVGVEGKKKKETSHLWACDPMKADINYNRLSFSPAVHHHSGSSLSRRPVELQDRQQSVLGPKRGYDD
jgi:hypothetical protein